MKRPRWGWLPAAAYLVLAVSGAGSVLVPPPSVVEASYTWTRWLFSMMVVAGGLLVAYGAIRSWPRPQYVGIALLLGPLLTYGFAVLVIAGPRGAFAAGLAFYATMKSVERWLTLRLLERAMRNGRTGE